MKEEDKYSIALAWISGVGPKTFKKIMEIYGTASSAFDAESGELVEKCNISRTVASAIRNFSDWGKVESELEYCDRNGIEIIARGSEKYPKLLDLLDDAPPILYIKGELNFEDALAIAIVGTRKPTAYGKETSRSLAKDLAEAGFTIVSGLARGIDEQAHWGALDAGKRTIAVTGAGVDVIYPKENKKLAEKISENGALISEFAPKTPPMPDNFPRRNRIISGLSLASVVVEAPLKSGALITARCAIEQNRELFAVPGNIGSKESEGTNKLIQSGAYLADSAKTIASIAVKAAENIFDTGALKRLIIDEMLVPKAGRRESDKAKLEELEENERKVLETMSFREPINIDDIIEKSGLASGEVLGIVIGLELKGLIEALPGMQYLRRR